jgi:hypothetical protein
MSAEKEAGAASIPPYALALVVCDAIWRDPGTGKRTILGCFSMIGAKSFPTKHPFMSVYAAVTDAHGIVPITLRLVDVDDSGSPLAEIKVKPEVEDPRAVLELEFALVNVVFPAPGEYRLQLKSLEVLLLERRIVVMQIGDQAHETDAGRGHH